MDCDNLWRADGARSQRRLPPADVAFVRDVVPVELESFPHLNLPKAVRHPAAFSISGAPVGTFLRSALLMAGQRALGDRYGGSEFYARVERDLAFGIMRSHFHHGYPKTAMGQHLPLHARRRRLRAADRGNLHADVARGVGEGTARRSSIPSKVVRISMLPLGSIPRVAEDLEAPAS